MHQVHHQTWAGAPSVLARAGRIHPHRHLTSRGHCRSTELAPTYVLQLTKMQICSHVQGGYAVLSNPVAHRANRSCDSGISTSQVTATGHAVS